MTNAELAVFAKRHPLSIGCGVLALALGAVSFYRGSVLPEATALFEQKSREGQGLSANLRNGNQLTEQLERLTAAAAEIRGRFVHSSELAQNLQYFYRLESETGVKLELRQNTSSTVAKSAKTTLGGVGFSVSLQGEYFAVLEFLRRLETGAHFCRVMSASLSGSGLDRTGPVNLSLELELLGQP